MSYRKGYKFEREVKKFLEDVGYCVIRSAGSKKPDMIAGKKGNVLVIECKYVSKNVVYLSKKEVDNLRHVAKQFNAEPAILVKRRRKGITMFSLNELKKCGKSYVAKLE